MNIFIFISIKMLGVQNQQPTVLDALIGSKSEWYNTIDDALKASEVIPGRYEYTTSPGHGNTDNVSAGDCTTFDVGCSRFEIVNINNSYAYCQQIVPITFPKMSEQIAKIWYIGYQFVAEIFDQYIIYSNTDKLQQVNHASYEWFMLRNSISDSAKEGNDSYATIDKIRRKDPFVPGVYVDLSLITAEKTINIKLPLLKIPLSSFLLLYNLRYHPEWAGKLSLECYPTYKNIVVAPVIPQSDIPLISEGLGGRINLGFFNLNQRMNNKLTFVNNAYAVEEQTFRCNSSNTTSNKIKLAKQMLRMDVYNSIASRYIQVPLMFPVQTVQIKTFETPIKDRNNQTSTTASVGLKHCDMMSIVVKSDANSSSCFSNPGLRFQINIDGKLYPSETYETLDDVRFLNMTYDALNINNSLLNSIPNDVKSSLQPYTKVQKWNAAGTGSTNELSYTLGDESNSFISIPFADDDDFMGGLTTGNNVAIQLIADRIGSEELKNKTFGQPVGIFFEDTLLKIRSMRPEGRPQIELTSATVEQIAAGVAQ